MPLEAQTWKWVDTVGKASKQESQEKERQVQSAVGFWKWEEIETQFSKHLRIKGGMKQDRSAMIGFQSEEKEC